MNDIIIFNNKLDYLLEGWTQGWDEELKSFIKAKCDLSEEEILLLIKRWKKYFFIYMDTYDGWIRQVKPYKTFTITQLEEENDSNLLIKRIDGTLCFRCGWIDGVFYNNIVPPHPVVSKFAKTNIHDGWMIHDESLFEIETTAIF